MDDTHLTPQQHVGRIVDALAMVENAAAVVETQMAELDKAQQAQRRAIGFLHARLHRAAKAYPDLIGMDEGEVVALSAGGQKQREQ